jgi:hypothetical protein
MLVAGAVVRGMRVCYGGGWRTGACGVGRLCGGLVAWGSCMGAVGRLLLVAGGAAVRGLGGMTLSLMLD